VSAVEHNLREEVAQSEADANEARNERDDTLRALEELRLKHKEEIAKLKASVRHSLTTTCRFILISRFSFRQHAPT